MPEIIEVSKEVASLIQSVIAKQNGGKVDKGSIASLAQSIADKASKK